MEDGSTAKRTSAQASRPLAYAVGGCAVPEQDPSSQGSFRYARDKDFFCIVEGDGEGCRASVMAEICLGRMEHGIQEHGCRSIEDMDVLVSDADAFVTEVRDYLSAPGRPGAPGVLLAAAVLDRERGRAIVGCSGEAAILLLRAQGTAADAGGGALFRLASSSRPLGARDDGSIASCAASSIRLGTGDCLLLCSREVVEHLSSGLITDMLSCGGSPRERAARLANLAAERCSGTPRRATAIVIDIASAEDVGAASAKLSPDSGEDLEGEAIAVLSEDRLTLAFLRHRGGPLPEGLVYAGFEEAAPVPRPRQKPFEEGAATVRTVIFKDRIRPRSCAWWFCSFQILEKVEGIELLDTALTESLRGMFCGCRSLQSLDLSAFGTSHVKDMAGMFFGCQELGSLSLWKTASPDAESLALMFRDCAKLRSIDLSQMDAHHVVDARSLLCGCSSLEEADLSGISVAPEGDMDSMLDAEGGLAEGRVSRLRRIAFGPEFEFRSSGVIPTPIGAGATGRWCWPDGSHALEPRGVELFENGCSERTVWVRQERP